MSQELIAIIGAATRHYRTGTSLTGPHHVKA